MRTPDLEIDLLRAFLAVVDSGGFTSAADLLGRTQSAVSQRIKRLEDSIGRRLFERTIRPIRLSAEGEVLLGYARRLIELNDEAALRVVAPEAAGHLRLGIAEDFVPHQLPRLLRRFARAYPRVKLTLTTGMSCDLVGRLESDELDLVVASRDGTSRAGRLLWREPLVWLAADDFLLEDAAPTPLVALAPPCTYRETALEALRSVGLTGEVACTSGSVAGLQAAVAAGLGITVLGASFAQAGLRVLDRQDGLPPLPTTEIAIFGEETAHAPIARPLVAFLQEELGAQLPRAA